MIKYYLKDALLKSSLSAGCFWSAGNEDDEYLHLTLNYVPMHRCCYLFMYRLFNICICAGYDTEIC